MAPDKDKKRELKPKVGKLIRVNEAGRGGGLGLAMLCLMGEAFPNPDKRENAMRVSKLIPFILVGLLAACGKSEPPKTEAPAPAPAAAAPAPVAQAAADGGQGAELFKKTCAMCHQTGVAGAPKLGDKADWGPRIAQGKDTLYKHATEGFNGNKGAMPAKGGNPALKDDEIKTIVDFMVSKSE